MQPQTRRTTFREKARYAVTLTLSFQGIRWTCGHKTRKITAKQADRVMQELARQYATGARP